MSKKDSSEVGNAVKAGLSNPKPNEKEESTTSAYGSVHRAAFEMQRAREAYKVFSGLEEKPSKKEVFCWCFYGFCSYFIHTVLIPIVFPLIISQIASQSPESVHGWGITNMGFNCSGKELLLYQRLTNQTIKVNHLKYSPLEWTSISWTIGLILAAPILVSISTQLDQGENQSLIAIIATFIGAIFCLPAGFFKTVWIFPPYIAVILITSMVTFAAHTRNLALMVCGFTGPSIPKNQIQTRRTISGRLSLYATAVGSLGSAIISSFTYHMLKEKEQFISLWVVSIFSGLIWLVGVFHFFITSYGPCNSSSSTTTMTHAFSIFKFPHAIGGLFGVFLSSLTTMCIFTSAVLYLVGEICLKPKYLLCFWLIYFLVPLISLPLIHALQRVIKTNAVKMQLVGFLLSAMTSGMGFYFKHRKWQTKHVLVLAAIQSTSNGILYAFGRVLLLDCSPLGKEGVFCSWYVWLKVMGSFVGFAFASAKPGKLGITFGVAFCSSIVAMLILILGNVSDFRGAIEAGHVKEDNNQQGSISGHGEENVMELKHAIRQEDIA